MDIKDNIKTICKARGRTLAQLANDLNITRQTLFRQLTGNTTTDTLKRIADCLNVPPFILLHPDPVRAMEQDDRPRPAPSYPAPVRLLCPCCNSPLLLSIQPAEEGRAPSDSQPGHNNQSNDGQDNNGQKTNKTTDETSPEEIKLFED